MMSYYSNLSFHTTCGENIQLSNASKTATCISSDSPQRFVFSSRPIRADEVVNLKIPHSYSNCPIGFGFTDLDPDDIDDLEDFHQLKENSCTWTHDLKITKLNSVLSFSYNDFADISFTLEEKSVTFPNRKISPEYDQWALIYVRGEDTCVTMVTAKELRQQQLKLQQWEQQHSQLQQEQQQNESFRNETCKICFRNKIDSVIYRCGHACMCMACADKQWNGKAGTGNCPVCRTTIIDIIKLYY